jgi:GDP-L-fucose synthase
VNDPGKPDGTPQKLLDVSTITRMGWKAQTSLQAGLAATYAWYLDQENTTS